MKTKPFISILPYFLPIPSVEMLPSFEAGWISCFNCLTCSYFIFYKVTSINDETPLIKEMYQSKRLQKQPSISVLQFFLQTIVTDRPCLK